ncbi:MAG: hypothetical protein HY736_00575 [Verrucomicrobia bacterium]|nr:hypothetical protein [Verrucomicrobiota bacterium]
MEPAGRMHHVFVDFENVQTIELASLGKKNTEQAEIADQLVQLGVIEIDPKGKVSYRLPVT